MLWSSNNSKHGLQVILAIIQHGIQATLAINLVLLDELVLIKELNIYMLQFV